MNQRSTFSRTKEPRREKIIRTRRDDDERFQDEPSSRRSSTERPSSSHGSSYSRFKDGFTEKSRPNSRDTPGSLVFRRQERGKLSANFSKNSAEVSPGRIPHSDSMKNDTPGRCNYISHYNRGTSNRDYASKRLDNSHIIDESRLKSYLQRLLRDEDKERQASLMRQLRIVFEHPDNYKVINSNKEDIFDNLKSFIEPGPISSLNAELRQEFILAVGTLGALLGVKARSLLDWEFDVVTQTSNSDDMKTLILKTINEMLKADSEKKNLLEVVPYIMTKLQCGLEIAENSEVLIAIVKVISEIACDYPSVFSKHFSDIVDILIGWHIDYTQLNSVIEFTSVTLIGFQPFWISDMHFTVTLLGQFLEDLESYAKGLPKVKPQPKKSVMYLKELAQTKLDSSETEDAQTCSPEENIAKIKSLIKVLITVLRSIGDLLPAEDSGPWSVRFVVEMLKSFLKYVKSTIEYCFISDLVTSANECLVLLLKFAPLFSKDALDQLMSYIDILQIKDIVLLNESCVVSVLSVMIGFVKAIGTYLPVKFVTQMFSSNSTSRSLRMSPSVKVQKLLIELYHIVLAMKNVQIVEEFYKCILVDIMEAHTELLKSKSEISMKEKSQEVSLLLSICALVEMGNVKHSLIRMFALNPCFFELMISRLKPSSPDLAKRYPALQSSILFILYSHCQRHSHFVNNSELVNPSNSVSPPSTSGHSSPVMQIQLNDMPPSTSPNRGNLEKIIRLLIDLLEGMHNSYDSRLLAAKWTIEILESIQKHLPRLIFISPFCSLLDAVLCTGFTSNIIIIKACCKSLHIILKSCAHILPDNTLRKFYELCILRMNSPAIEVQEAYAALFALLPVDIVLHGLLLNVSKSVCVQSGGKDHDISYKSHVSILDIWTTIRAHMSRVSSLNFYSQHFRIVTGFILQGKEPQEKNWLLRLFNSCPPPERNGRQDVLLKQLCNSSLSVLWFWAVWEVALSCVTSKLRTPLGKPQETFMAIEAALKSAAKPSKGQEGSNSEQKHTTLLRNNLLLNLMENLEKLMYNAYEGCASAFSPPQKFLPQNVRTFFRTNKSTCHEWLGRVRSSAVAVAMNAGCPAAAVRHAFELLHELKNSGNAQGAEFESILYAVVKALILLHCPEAILGLYVWCKENVNRKFTWMKASVDCAAGRLEVSVHEYLCILQSLSEGLSLEKLKTNLNENDKSKNESTDPETPKVNGNEVSINKPKIDIYLHSFLINQIVDCYVKLQNWPDALKWSEFLDQLKFLQNGLTHQIASSSNNLSHLRCLYSFEEASAAFSKKDATTLLNNLANSDSLINSSWTTDDIFSKTQKTLMSVAISAEAKSKSVEHIRDLTDQINDAKSSVLKLMKVSTLNWPFQIDANQANLFLSASSFQFNKKGSSLVLRENVKFDSTDCYSSNLGFLLNWENIWLRLNQSSTGKLHGGFFNLLMTTARLARKKENMTMCHKLLLKALNYLCKNSQNYEVKDVNFLNSCDPSNISSLNATMKKTLTWVFTNDKLVKIQRESAKLLHSCGETDSAFDLLLSSISKVSSHLRDSNISNGVVDQLSELNARSLLNLVKYAQQNTKFNPQDHGSKDGVWNFLLSKTVQNLKSSDSSILGVYVENGIQQEHVVSDSEFLIGQLLQSSVQQCPTLGKSWSNLASWCYVHGNKVVNAACNESLNMLPEDKAKLLSLIPNAHKEDMDVLLNIVTSLHNPLGSEWDNQETDYTESGAEEIRWQLLTYCPFLLKQDNHELVIENILEIWKDLVTRAYSYYRIAAISYLQYLKLNGKTVSEKMEDDNVTATLRLLRLVVKHASELRDVLEEGLAETPTTPWRGIIPQLFSRLNHPEPYVRQSISDLLCRVAHAAPHLIVFPAVVGSLTLKMGPQLEEQATGLLGAYLTEEVTEDDSENSTAPEDPIPEEDSEEECRRTAAMQNCFSALVETLGSQDERTICEAKRLVHELHRITLLWDELWIGTLGMHQGEVNRRFLNLEKEITKVMNNTFLSKEEKNDVIKEKHNVYVKPTLFLLEQLQTITSQPAETPHEQWFQSTLGKPIENALKKLRDPEDPSRPQEILNVFRQLYQLIQCEAQKQQSGAHLSMCHISPVLASLKNTVIPMPGINKPGACVTVQSVLDTVSILPTKTKPKKLTFIGSDGQRYAYLFKGLEDLHLDERIMQFLSIVNNMFAKSKKHGKQVFYARHYSVTPLGPRSGLIQWVDGATPLFGLYKRWQQREACANSTKKQSSSNVGAILRPSEIFYNKLTPLLKEKNINLDNRKDWPMSVLLEVLKQLMSETPDNLLAKELWCCCSSAQEWWNVTLTYNHSTAVMSMIGYIIGLGDRHLDNVLVDLATGEVVHIDYNVCFEKGKNLRVPEKVPFRMTPNIKTALGLTGIEGVFRTACEHALKSLRKGRETLLTLLEAFVYDPLVDWTPGGEGGYPGAVYGGRQAWAQEARITKQSMESEIAKAMFAIRTAEIKGEWLKNREDLLAAFPKLGSLLQGWKNAQQELQVVESALQDACQEKALLEEALANPSHNLYSVPQRYDETTIVRTTVNATKDAVKEKLNECKKWHALHCEALSTICGSELSKKYGDVLNDQDLDNLSVAPVVEFLQSAGQGQLVQQCEHAESELASTLHQRQLTMRNCLELLTTYATIVLQFGPSYKEQNRCFKWQNWLEDLLSDFSSRRCKEIQTEFENQYGIESQDAIQLALSLNVQFQAILNDTNSGILAILERIRLEGVDDKNALTAFAEETKCSILHFLKESDQPCHLAFLCVLGEKLSTIRKQLFLMERAAGASGDRLVDLTSWKGDWYLDGISNICGNLAQHVQLLIDSSAIDNAELKSTLHGVKLSQFVFNALEDLSLHFQNIILPEAIQTALEPSVIEMVAKLDRIIARCGIPLDKLVADLELNITNLILKAPVLDNHVSDTVKKLKNEFESLMQRSEPQITGLNQGQMLLMGFNGLFTKVDSDLEALLLFLDNLPVPECWQKLDFYAETIHLAPAVHHFSARPILRDIYFVKKLVAMQQAFHVCHAFAASLHVHPRIIERNPEPLLAEHQLVKPVKQYTADYVRHMVLGLPSQAVGFGMCVLASQLGCDISAEVELRDIGVESKTPADEILDKAVKTCVARNFLEPQSVTLGSLLLAFDSAWHKEDMARRLEQYLLVSRGSQQRAQLQLARFQWLNEDFLNPGNVQNSTVSSRASVMSEIKKSVSALVAFECVVNSAQERYISLTAGIEQRLKWAAGANPSLTAVQDEFEAAIAAKTSSITKANQISRELVNMCNSVLHFEAFRTRTTEAHSFDTSFVGLLSRCKETCDLAETCLSQISPIEEHLIALKPIEKEGVTAEWLMSIIKLVSQSLGSCREKLELQKTATNLCWESLQLQVAYVHDLLSVHHKLMSEVRHILKNLAKHEEQELGSEVMGPIQRYTTLYREFSECITGAVSRLLSGGQDAEAMSSIESQLPAFGASAAEVYDQLLVIAGPLGGKQVVVEMEPSKLVQLKKNLLSPMCDSLNTLSPSLRSKTPRSGTPKKSAVTRDPRTGKAVQERNSYATNVWKRIKMKLDGRDPDPSKKSSIGEQVDFVIKEATHLENLAVLYEGWTPWV